jgi:eukaryotic-like serine/threonine-protein kinase
MRPNVANLASLVASVADGWPQDWVALNDGADDDVARRAVQNLQVISRIAAFHRNLSVADRPAVRKLCRSSAHVSTLGLERRARQAPLLGRWGRFQLWKKLGEGAHGYVYSAYDPELDRDVALKLLKRSASSSETTRRLLLEARMLAQVRHPNVASVYDVGEHDGQAGLWMELVRGSTLEELLSSRGPMSAAEASLVGQDLCRALAAVHGAGLVHRDVKTGNVIREVGGRIVLTDLSAGRYLRDAQRQFAGTPCYAAPEVVAGAEATVQSDTYSLGVVLFRLVTGGYPRQAGRVAHRVETRVCRTPLYDALSSLRDLRPDLPDAFVVAVEQALARDPSERPQSDGAFLASLGLVLGVPASRQGTGTRPGSTPASPAP